MLANTKRPDLVRHPDSVVLEILLATGHAEAMAVAVRRGVDRHLAASWFYRAQRRALRLAREHNIPSRKAGEFAT